MASKKRKITITSVILIVIACLNFVGFERLFSFFKWANNQLNEQIAGWWVLIFILFLAIMKLLIFSRNRKRYKKSGFAVWSYPGHGYKDIGYKDWGGTKWLLRYPNPSPTSGLFHPKSLSEKISQLSVEGPFCPKCKTELSQKQRLVPGFVWICENCRFKINKRYNIYEGREKALKVFQGEFRKSINNE